MSEAARGISWNAGEYSIPESAKNESPAVRKTARDGCEQRLQAGRAQRKALNRRKLGELPSRKKRADPIDLLLHSTEGRVRSLLPVKYARMSASPFAFFRGAVSIMAADLAASPHTDLAVQLCGDAHVQNLGSFEAPDGRLVFDINDFDETIPGPWEWDVKRMAASIALAGSESNHTVAACARPIEQFAASYCRTIEELADQPVLVAARRQIHRLKEVEAVSAALRQAQRASPEDLLRKYTQVNASGQVIFKTIRHALWRLQAQQRRDVLDSLTLYRESLAPDRVHLFDFFRPLDVGFKVVGTGSVGLRDFVVLMEGNGKTDTLFLQIKQEVASAYAPYLTGSVYAHQGERVASAQRKVQPLSDLLLGWTRIGEHDYLVRQLNDHKGSVDLERLRGEGLTSLARIAGELLARGHARSGDALMIKGYIGSYDKVVRGILQFGADYAAQTNADFTLFQRAIRDGKIKCAE